MISYLAVMASLITAPHVLPQHWSLAAPAVVVVLAGLVVLASAMRRRGPSRRAWTFLGAGVLAWAAGECLWDWQELHGREALPFPSLADVCYLGAVPLLAAGLCILGRLGGRSVYRFHALDMVVICIGAGAAIWTLSAGADGTNPAEGLERILLVVYPTADVVLVGMSSFALTATARNPALRWLTLGVACLVIADVAFVHQVQLGTYSSSDPVDVFWPLAFALMGLGAMVPDPPADASREALDRGARALSMLLFGSTLLIPISGAWAWSRDVAIDVPVLVGAASLMTVLVLLRLTSVTRSLERAYDELRISRDRVDRSSELRGLLLERAARVTEDGRRNVASDLHDGPIQNLAALQYAIEAERMSPEPDVEAVTHLAVQGLAQEIRNLRGIMAWLRPPSLDERGLESAITDLGSKLGEGSLIRVQVRCCLDVPLAPDLAGTVYRLVEETLRNVARHAAASHVFVDLRSDAGTVSFRVVDDGIGFDPQQLVHAPLRGRFGLASMQERVTLAGGRCELSATPGRGVSIRVLLPNTPSFADREPS